MSFQIDISSFLDFAENMGVAEDRLHAELAKEAQPIGREGVRIARSILSANDSIVTGNLSRSLRVLKAGWAGSQLLIQYGPGSEYPASWVEHGRGAVRAREGGYLKFQIKRRGPYIFTKSVGPAAPRPFMRPSVERLRPYATKRLGDAVMRAVEGMV